MIKGLLPKNEFGRNVLTLMTGTTISQAVPIAMSPIFSRMFSPADFGLFALYTSVLSILIVIATGRYELAIMLPKEDEEAVNLLALSSAIAVVVALLSGLALFIFRHQIGLALGNTAIEYWLFLIPFAVLVTGVQQALSYWGTRRKYYKTVAGNRVLQSGSIATSTLLMGLNGVGAAGLIVGNFLGQVIATSTLLWRMFGKDHHLFAKITQAEALRLGKRYISFLKFGVVALLTSSIAQQSLFFLVVSYLNEIILGYISLVQRVIGIPATVIGNNLGDVFYQHISQTPKEKSFQPVLRFAAKLSLFSLGLHIVLYLVCAYFFVWIFGQQWAGAVLFVKYLILVSAFSFVFSPLSILFNYYEIQKINFFWQASWLLSNILIFFLYKRYSWSVESLFLVYAVKQSLLYLIGILGFVFIAKRWSHET